MNEYQTENSSSSSTFERLPIHFSPRSVASNFGKRKEKEMMNPKTEKVVRITTVASTVVVSYFLLTADYGPEPNVLDPVKKAILSAESSVKEFIFGPKKKS